MTKGFTPIEFIQFRYAEDGKAGCGGRRKDEEVEEEEKRRRGRRKKRRR